MTLNVQNLADEIHRQLALQLIKDAGGDQVTAPADMDTGLQRMAVAIAGALVPYLTTNAVVTTDVPNVGPVRGSIA
jgi:hypothetical protein